jgi:hypothetical protein
MAVFGGVEGFTGQPLTPPNRPTKNHEKSPSSKINYDPTN